MEHLIAGGITQYTLLAITLNNNTMWELCPNMHFFVKQLVIFFFSTVVAIAQSNDAMWKHVSLSPAVQPQWEGN